MKSLKDKESLILSSFKACAEGEGSYLWLINKAKDKPYKPTMKERYKLKGCLSITYFQFQVIDGSYIVNGWSESNIIYGILRVIIEIYDGESVDTKFSPSWHLEMNLQSILTYQRWLSVKYMLEQSASLADQNIKSLSLTILDSTEAII